MTKYRIIWRWPALCKGLHCVVIRTPYPIRIREGFKKELCQQFTVLHIRISYQLQFSQKVIWKGQKGKGQKGEVSPCLQPRPIELAPSSATPSTGTPRNAPAMEMPLRLEGRR
jgi:hypothetical protein